MGQAGHARHSESNSAADREACDAEDESVAERRRGCVAVTSAVSPFGCATVLPCLQLRASTFPEIAQPSSRLPLRLRLPGCAPTCAAQPAAVCDGVSDGAECLLRRVRRPVAVREELPTTSAARLQTAAREQLCRCCPLLYTRREAQHGCCGITGPTAARRAAVDHCDCHRRRRRCTSLVPAATIRCRLPPPRRLTLAFSR